MRPAVALAWLISRRHHLHSPPPHTHIHTTSARDDRRGRDAFLWCGVVRCGVVRCGVVRSGVVYSSSMGGSTDRIVCPDAHVASRGRFWRNQFVAARPLSPVYGPQNSWYSTQQFTTVVITCGIGVKTDSTHHLCGRQVQGGQRSSGVVYTYVEGTQSSAETGRLTRKARTPAVSLKARSSVLEPFRRPT